MVFSNTWILPLKIFFISTGVLSIALFFKTSVPFVMDFSTSTAPVIWSSFVSWLKPPYLYLIMNGIIIGIAASARFYQNGDSLSSTESSSSSSSSSELSSLPPDVEYEMEVKSDFGSAVYELQQAVVEEEEAKAPVFEEKSVVVSEVVELGCAGDATWTPPISTESSDVLSELNLTWEKPLVSTRFGHRKPVKASPEGGKALRVTKPKRHDTLENTWKAITEGRAMPLMRHLKKSDTWENHGRHIDVDSSTPVKKAETFKDRTVKKSETFKDRTNYQLPPVNSNSYSSPGSGGKLTKEPSLSQDELNRRVEAFIKKFNEEMRLQRQESLRQYQEMIGRGV